MNRIIEEGQEYGSTTGRKRLVNWLNLDKLKKAIALSGCTELIINKCDVLEKIKEFKVIHGNELQNFTSFAMMSAYIQNELMFTSNSDLHNITFSGDKESI